MQRTVPGGLAVMLSLALLSPAPSQACLHEIELSKDDAVAAVARAERLLTRGRAAAAYRTSRRARRWLERELRRRGPDAATAALVERSRQITAVAVVRLDGHAPLSRRAARRHVLRGRAERSLRWALGQLRAQARRDPGDLRARARYAEALAHFEEHREEARSILLDLAERDLVPGPHGYATLLRLLEPGSERWHHALTRCHQIAAEDAPRICPAASSSSS